jgi:multidrug efflux pump
MTPSASARCRRFFTQLNQYHVVLEAQPAFRNSPADLNNLYVQSTSGGAVPLSAFTQAQSVQVPLTVNHQGQFPTVTVSFNLAPGASLGDGVTAVNRAQQELGLPASIRTSFQGTAHAFEASLVNEPFLILAALITVYIVLGVLYESYVHPVTILSTLPSAGVGALFALILCGTDFNVIALIGIILLIGIVKKNGIMMIDFALGRGAQRRQNPARGNLSSLYTPLPTDPDDDNGGTVGWGAARSRDGHGRGAPPPVGHFYDRRLDLQPVADALHYARDLFGF